MWVKKAAVLEEPAMKPVTELLPGEIFSLNEKSKKFAFLQTTGAGDIMAQPMSPEGQLGAPVACPLDSGPGANVMVHPTPVPEPGLDLSQRQFEYYDRVELRDATLAGTVIDTNITKFPDVDIIVLWDKPIHGHVITEVHPHEINMLGIRAEGLAYDMAKEAREYLRNMQDQQHRHRDQQIKNTVETVHAAGEKRREEYGKKLKAEEEKRVLNFTEQVIDEYAADFKIMVNAGVLRITAGPYDYEVDEVPKFINDFAESIYAKVGKVCSNLDLQMPVTSKIMTHIAAMIFDNYHLVRQACIRKGKLGGYGVFSKSGELLGKFHKVKRGALQQIRASEYFDRHKA